MMRKLLNFAAFQLSWFANVLGAAHGMPGLGPLVTGTWMLAHFATLREEAAVEGRVILVAAALGWLADSTLVLTGLVTFAESARLGGPSPLWMVALWVGFAATLRHALGWLRGRWLLAAALGAVGGPLAYLGGEALGGIALAGDAALIAIAAQYALATPLLLVVVHRSERPQRAACAEVAPEMRT